MLYVCKYIIILVWLCGIYMIIYIRICIYVCLEDIVWWFFACWFDNVLMYISFVSDKHIVMFLLRSIISLLSVYFVTYNHFLYKRYIFLFSLTYYCFCVWCPRSHSNHLRSVIYFRFFFLLSLCILIELPSSRYSQRKYCSSSCFLLQSRWLTLPR